MCYLQVRLRQRHRLDIVAIHGEARRHLVLLRLAHIRQPRVVERGRTLHPFVRVHGQQLLAQLDRLRPAAVLEELGELDIQVDA